MYKTRPQAPDAIRQEIADLKRRRDIMLKNAPKHVFFARIVMPLIFVPALLGLAARLANGRSPLIGGLILALVCAMAGAACYKLWRPGLNKDDLWAASDRVGYEGDSPRDLQRRIDAMEAKLGDHGS